MPKNRRRRKPARRPGRETKHTDPSPSTDRRQQGGGDRASGSWKFHAVALLVICCLGAAIYSNALHGDFVFDDHHNIDQNPYLTRVSELDGQRLYEAGTKSPSPRPVANISFALNHWWGRLDVTGYHLVNTVIHLLCGILVYFLASTTFRLSFGTEHRETMPAGDRAIAWMSLFAACIFVAHPLQTQAVTYIVQRMTSMATMFYLLSLLLYLQGRLGRGGWRRWVLWAGCLLSWMLALGSKQIAATLPLLIVLYEWYFFQDLSKEWLRRSLKYFLALVVVAVVVALVCLGTSPWERILASYDTRDFTLGERVLTQPRVLIRYLGLVTCPLPSRLNLIHHVSTSRSLLEPITTLFSIVTIAGLGALAVTLARRQRLVSFCILWFFLNLAIESSVIGLEMIYEHRLYLPLFAFALAVPYGVYCLPSKRAVVAGLVGVVVILGLGTGTYVRNQVWQDKVVLWSDVITKNPLAHRARNNLGVALEGQGKLVEASEYYLQAIQIKPDYAEAHNHLGAALEGQGKLEEAIGHCHQALRIKPDYAEAHHNLGNALEGQGKLVEAIEHYHQALRIKPDYAVAHNNLGVALQRQGKLVEAIKHYHQALRTKPDFARAHINQGVAVAEQGKLVEAIEHFQQALRIKPDFARAHHNLGNALQGQGKLVEAIEHYRQALRIKPDYAEAHINLGVILKSQGKLVEAIEHYHQGLRMKPDHAEAHNNLGVALAGQGKLGAAIEHFHQALRINPDDAKAHNNLGIALGMQAAADAEAGRFDEAITTALKAVAAATAAGNEQLAREIRKRVASYRQAVSQREPHE